MKDLIITPKQLEQLADMIANRILQKPRCVDKAELSRTIGISISTIERLLAENKIPCIRANRRVLFDIDSVIQALSEFKPRNGTEL
jgi:hypothetical protein